jgi:hypothetical protein
MDRAEVTDRVDLKAVGRGPRQLNDRHRNDPLNRADDPENRSDARP